MTDRTTQLTATTVERLLVDTDPYLSCDECFARIDEYVDRLASVPGHRDVLMETHLRGCGVCAEEAAALTELVGGSEPEGTSL
jgi:hypothetical protein